MPSIARDLGISRAMGGIVWGAASLGIALASLLGGAAVDRFGPRRVAGAALLVGAVACAARAWATGPWTLAIVMLVFGAHIGFSAPAIPKALAAHVEPARLARANGVALLGYTFGTAATVIAAPALLAPALGGWRPTMVLAGAAMAVVAGAWWVLARSDGRQASVHASLRAVFALAKNRQLLRVAAMHFLLFGGYLALLGLLPRALVEAGMPARRVGVAVACWLAAAGVANYFGPWFSDRIGRRRPVLLTGGLVAGVALGVFALSPPASAPVLLVVAALGGGCVAPLLLALPAEVEGVGAAHLGAALGLMMLIGQVGGFLLPAMAGAASQLGSLAGAVGALAVAHLAILVPAFGLRETRAPATPGAPLVESSPAR